MRVILQRVDRASVFLPKEDVTAGTIERGLLLLVGVAPEDSQQDIDYLVDKIVNLRIFEDERGKMNLSALDVGAQALVVSQFTLYADCRKGRRPSFTRAAAPDKATQLVDDFTDKIKQQGLVTATGKFGAFMDVALVNSGPVTIILDSAQLYY